MLYIFGGLPGTGKSTLASALARRCHAVYIRIDTIEQAIRNSHLIVDGPVGYNIGYSLALNNLYLGLDVVVDSVNPLDITRKAWIDVALQAQKTFIEIEIVCCDRHEHRQRIESRQSDIAGLKLPQWQDVIDRHYDL
jgi:predicted kinase